MFAKLRALEACRENSFKSGAEEPLVNGPSPRLNKVQIERA